jgi:hypothetical protein
MMRVFIATILLGHALDISKLVPFAGLETKTRAAFYDPNALD